MLRLKLKDTEQVIINGAVMRAAGRVDLLIENDAAILRGREIMQPDEATTTARQLYFCMMMDYIEPDAGDRHADAIIRLLGECVALANSAEEKLLCARLAHELARARHYQALTACRQLIAMEDCALAACAAGVANHRSAGL